MLAIWCGSSAFSKATLSIWNFMIHVLLKPGLENFYFTSVWDERNCAQFEHFLTFPFLGIGMKTDLFQSCGHCWVFQICWHIECSTFTALSFRIWNSSTGMSSPPLALFIVVLSKAHLTSHSRMSGSTNHLLGIVTCSLTTGIQIPLAAPFVLCHKERLYQKKTAGSQR